MWQPLLQANSEDRGIQSAAELPLYFPAFLLQHVIRSISQATQTYLVTT